MRQKDRMQFKPIPADIHHPFQQKRLSAFLPSINSPANDMTKGTNPTFSSTDNLNYNVGENTEDNREEVKSS